MWISMALCDLAVANGHIDETVRNIRATRDMPKRRNSF